MLVFVVRRRNELLWRQVTPMAGAASHRLTRVVNHVDILGIDLFDHLVHETRGSLFLLGVVREIQARLAVGPDVIGIGRMTGAALGAQRRLPLVHEIVDLLAGHCFRQDLEIGRRRCFTVESRRSDPCGLLGRRRSLCKRSDGESSSQQRNRRG